MNTDKIVILDDHTANQIAAGEVVERPSSVVKELVENAIDAQARRICVEIRNGGVDYIRVTDDGEGMSPQDAQACLLRHATSKIRQAQDLLELCTLGFRGEALPSIASVSRLTILTRQAHQEWATLVEIEPGEAPQVSDAGGDLGTTITVKDLFYNTPARRKFLRTTPTEVGYITDMLSRLAISRPDISFTLINNQRTVFMTPGGGDEQEAITSVYGYQLCDQLLELAPTSSDSGAIQIAGYIGKPSIVKSSRQWQTVTVNQRVISSKMLSRAIDQSYHSLLPSTGHPFAVIHIQIPSDQVDVNVHPQKAEIKFADERVVFQLVHRAIRDRLIRPEGGGDDEETDDSPTIEKRIETFAFPGFANAAPAPVPTFTPYSQPAAAMDAAEPVVIREATPYFPTETETASTRLAASTALPQAEPRSTVEPVLPPVAATEPTPSLLHPLGQVEQKYIVAAAPDGLYLIDQHAAHERVLYDRLSNRSQAIEGQQLLLPIFMEISGEEEELLSEHQQLLQEFSFSCSLAGPGKLRIDEVPADIATAEAEPLLREIFHNLRNHHRISQQELRHLFLQSAACHGAIRAGQTLSLGEMQRLLQELAALNLPYTCPHGRPCIIRFSSNDLGRMFKRT